MLTALTLAALLAAPGDFKTPDTLQPLADQLNAICLKFGGRIGYSLKTLRDGKQISFRGDEVFPSASTIKTGVMIAAIQMVDDGKMTWKDTRVVPKLENREASMWSYWFREGTKCDLDGWVNLMVGVSDNTATMVVRDWIGTLEVNRRLEALGLKNTKILGNAPESATETRRLRGIYGMGMTTPNEMLRLLELVHQRKAASEAGCDKAIRILAKQYWDDWIAGAVPPSVRNCHQVGRDHTLTLGYGHRLLLQPLPAHDLHRRPEGSALGARQRRRSDHRQSGRPGLELPPPIAALRATCGVREVHADGRRGRRLRLRLS